MRSFFVFVFFNLLRVSFDKLRILRQAQDERWNIFMYLNYSEFSDNLRHFFSLQITSPVHPELVEGGRLY